MQGRAEETQEQVNSLTIVPVGAGSMHASVTGQVQRYTPKPCVRSTHPSSLEQGNNGISPMSKRNSCDRFDGRAGEAYGDE